MGYIKWKGEEILQIMGWGGRTKDVSQFEGGRGSKRGWGGVGPTGQKGRRFGGAQGGECGETQHGEPETKAILHLPFASSIQYLNPCASSSAFLSLLLDYLPLPQIFAMLSLCDVMWLPLAPSTKTQISKHETRISSSGRRVGQLITMERPTENTIILTHVLLLLTFSCSVRVVLYIYDLGTVETSKRPNQKLWTSGGWRKLVLFGRGET